MANLKQFVTHYKIGFWTIVIILILLASFALGVWLFGWGWTGFLQYSTETITATNTTIEIHPGKTLWDVLELIIIPTVLALGIFFLNQAQRQNEQAIEERREQELILQNYLDRMTNLILESGLGKSKPGHEVSFYLDAMKKLLFEGELDQAKEASLRDELWSGLDNKVSTIARTLTMTTLRRLNGERKGVLLCFLYEAELITVKENTLSPPLILRDADLTEADLSRAFLGGADLTGVNLSEAILTQTDLSGTTLTDANLSGAKLQETYLSRADLTFAKLSGSYLNRANLYGVNLQKGTFYGADLRDADLRDADLRGTDLCEAKLIGARLEGVLYNKETVWPKDFTPPSEAIKTD